MQIEKVKKNLAWLKLEILIMEAENKESGQPCAVKALTLSLAIEKINFIEDFINNNFKTVDNEK